MMVLIIRELVKLLFMEEQPIYRKNENHQIGSVGASCKFYSLLQNEMDSVRIISLNEF